MKTNEEIIEEAYDKGYSDAMMEEWDIGSSDQTAEEYAKEKAKELSQPVQSPSDLIVEVEREEIRKKAWNEEVKEGAMEMKNRGFDPPFFHKRNDVQSLENVKQRINQKRKGQ